MLVRAICLRFHWQRSFTDVTRLFGTVANFDRSVGLGVIDGEGKEFPFHATALANGTRDVAVGAHVSFTTVHASGGRLEAGDIAER